MKQPWPELSFWQTGEYQVIQEKLDDLAAAHVLVNPDRKSILASLRHTSMQDCKAILLGQDPYPDHSLATGLAYSTPEEIPASRWPPTLNNIFKEYQEDLGFPKPASGSLIGWADEGVLLWNVIPTCTAGRSLSHNWVEWTYLTQEILEKTTAQGVVVVLMGNNAQKFERYVDQRSTVICTSHPSPLAYMGGRTPRNSFLGSKVFSRVNAELVKLGKEPINWRLEDAVEERVQEVSQKTPRTRSPSLENIVG